MSIGRPRILCVDDEPEVLKFLERMLVVNGYEAIKAENGERALDQIKQRNIDLVISDVKMPTVDGFELCRRIKTDEQFVNIPVILITGYSAKDDRIKGIEAGAEDFLSKPIDTLEVLARIKMLLKVKSINEKRIGELLVDMKFITEQQLQEALLISKERNIKVGEALHSMGALDKDHIYWVLGNQLKMNYIELSEDMLDKDLIRQFPIDLLERLLCLPLYEAEGEMNYAIADPTDQKIIDEVKQFRPDKTVQFHLALPEKITTLLRSVREFHSKQKPGYLTAMTAPSMISPKSSVWEDFLSLLLSMTSEDRYWFFRTPWAGRLFTQRGDLWGKHRDFSQESCSLIYERLNSRLPSDQNGKTSRVFFDKKSNKQKGLFQLQHLDCTDKDIILIERIPTWSPHEFIASHPQAKGLIDQIQHLVETYQLLIIGSSGGSDRLLLKQCCYSCVTLHDQAPFPPAFFIEDAPEFYLEEVVQLSKDQMDGLNAFNGKLRPFIFYEWELNDVTEEKRFPWNTFKKAPGEIIISSSFPSAEAMQKGLMAKDFLESGLKPFYLDRYDLKCLEEENPC